MMISLLFVAIASAFTLDKPVDIFTSLETKPEKLSITFKDPFKTKELCINSRFRQSPSSTAVNIDGKQTVGSWGTDTWTIFGNVCGVSADDFIFSCTKNSFSGHIDFNEIAYVVEDNKLVAKVIDNEPDETNPKEEAAEMQMLQLTQFEIDRVVQGATLRPGQVTVYLHVDIDDTLSTRLIPTGQNLAAGRQAAMQYMIQLVGWINENVYYENGYNLQVSGVNFRSQPLSNQLSSLQYIYAMEKEPKKSNAHLTYHATAARLGGGIASLRGLYSSGSRGNGLCGNMRGDWSVWDRMCTAHEIGHNIGGPHTHDVGIDQCGTTCTSGGSEPIYNTNIKYGTVMSYCHLCRGGKGYNNNIKFEFHPDMIVKSLHAAYTAYQTRMNEVAPGTKPLVDGVGIPGGVTTAAPVTEAPTTLAPVTQPPATQAPPATQVPEATQPPATGDATYQTVRTSAAIGGGKCGHVVYGDNNGNGACQKDIHTRMWMCGGLANCQASGITDIKSCAAKVKATAACTNTFDTFNPSTVSRYGFRRCSCLLKIGGALQADNLVYVDIHQLQDTTQAPPAAGQNTYTQVVRGCVIGSNIKKYTGQTVAQCTEICNNDANCLAFEFGVNHNGASDLYKPGDCQPQSSANLVNCDGGRFNLDLYIKNSNSNGGGNVALDDNCKNIICQNGGECTGGQCTCKAGFSGTLCEINAPDGNNCKTTDGKKCLPFFKYQGKIWSGCTIVDSQSGKPWCATSQAGESLEFGECDMGAGQVKVGALTSTGCRQMPNAVTLTPWTEKSSYKDSTKIDNGAWQDCSQTTGTREWAEDMCNKDNNCHFLHDTDCDAKSFRYCSGKLSNQPIGQAQACTYEKTIPQKTICADVYELDFCQTVVETDLCSSYGKNCEKSCNYCQKKLVGEDGTLPPIIQGDLDREEDGDSAAGILTTMIGFMISILLL